MTLEEFGKPMQKLSCAFRGRFAMHPNDSDSVKESVLGVWYEYLGEYHAEDFNTAVNKWILEKDEAPTIHEIRIQTLNAKYARER